MLENLHVLIMAGGVGSRFWPLSRRDLPKQFLALTGERTLLEETVARIEGLCPRENLWVLTRRELRARVEACLPWLSAARLVAEPEGRDTAPCLVYAGVRVERADPEALLLVLPADHVIPDAAAFRAAVRSAVQEVERHDALVTFGIRPTYPATGFGYIQRAGAAGIAGGSHPVAGFKEKPKLEVARALLEAGDCYWNAGIFLWRLSTFHAALEQHAPALAQGWSALERLGARVEDPGDPETERTFRALPKISIDYALLERARNVRVVEAHFEWDDVGSWLALARHRPVDRDGNVTGGELALVDVSDCVVLGSTGRLIAGVGLEGLVIVDTPDATLICPKGRVEEVKKLVEQLQSRGKTEHL